MSCERLRALLPRFDGRREDMASVLEMAVQFLRLTHTLVPGWEQHAVSCGCVELVRPLQHSWLRTHTGAVSPPAHASSHSPCWLWFLQGTAGLVHTSCCCSSPGKGPASQSCWLIRRPMLEASFAGIRVSSCCPD